MTERVLVEQAISTVDVPRGTQVWVDDSEHVARMAAAGFWRIVERAVPALKPSGRHRQQRIPVDAVQAVQDAVVEVVEGGDGPAEPGGDAGGDQPDRVA